VNENFKDAYVKKSSQITKANGKVTYSVKVKDVVLTFDSNGKYLKPTV
jgi:hypothetical protein